MHVIVLCWLLGAVFGNLSERAVSSCSNRLAKLTPFCCLAHERYLDRYGLPRDHQGKRLNLPYIGPLTRVILLKLFLGIVPSSSADITHVFHGSFCEGSDYMYVVSFRFKAWKTCNTVGCLLWYFEFKQGSPGSRYVLIRFETLIGV